MVDIEVATGETIPGGGPTNKMGWPIPVPIAATTGSRVVFGPACLLVGWSLRDSSDGGGATVHFHDGGDVNAPIAGVVKMASVADVQRTDTQLGSTVSGANQQVAASIGGGGGTTAYVTSALIQGLGATGAVVVTAVLSGVLGGSISIPVSVPAGATVPITPVSLQFGGRGLQASAAGTPIVLTVPAFGAGNTFEQATLQGSFLATLGASSTQWLGSEGVYLRGGLFMEVVAGSVVGTVWVRL